MEDSITSHTYYDIVNYLQIKGWVEGPEEGSFCPGKEYKDKSVMVSGYFPVNDRKGINVIANDGPKGNKKISICYLFGLPKKEEYRIDFEIEKPNKGWHLDSDYFGRNSIKHYKLEGVKDWKDAINLITQKESYLLKEVISNVHGIDFTAPENILLRDEQIVDIIKRKKEKK